MVEALGRFEESDLPEAYKAALRITGNLAVNPALIDDDVWAAARAHFTSQEVIDIVLLPMFTTRARCSPPRTRRSSSCGSGSGRPSGWPTTSAWPRGLASSPTPRSWGPSPSTSSGPPACSSPRWPR